MRGPLTKITKGIQCVRGRQFSNDTIVRLGYNISKSGFVERFHILFSYSLLKYVIQVFTIIKTQ